MMKRYGLILASLAFLSLISRWIPVPAIIAQGVSRGPLIMQNGGTPIGAAITLNCSTGLTCTNSGGTVTATASGTSLSLETNGTPNGSQSLLNLEQGTGITVVDDGSGGVTISGSAGIVSVVTQSGAPSGTCTPPSSSNLAFSFDTTGKLLYYCNAATSTWRQLIDNGAGSGYTSAIALNGITSGTAGFTVGDIAGTAILYVLPTTNGSAGQSLEDSGSTTCPSLAPGFPTNCHQLVWATNAVPIANGQTAMPTTLLGANSCDVAATTATATGALTTDAPAVAYASDPTGVPGYGGGTNGGITIRFWVTAGTMDFKRCNETGSGITPGALSLNWRIER